jgi:hypothetical protein
MERGKEFHDNNVKKEGTSIVTFHVAEGAIGLDRHDGQMGMGVVNSGSCDTTPIGAADVVARRRSGHLRSRGEEKATRSPVVRRRGHRGTSMRWRMVSRHGFRRGRRLHGHVRGEGET